MTCVALFLIGSYTGSMRLHNLGGGEDVGDVREVRECQWKSDLEELLRGVTTCVDCLSEAEELECDALHHLS
jgi:hypothetical protein